MSDVDDSAIESGAVSKTALYDNWPGLPDIVQRAVDLGKEFRRNAPPSEEERKILFSQSAETVQAQIGEKAGE